MRIQPTSDTNNLYQKIGRAPAQASLTGQQAAGATPTQLPKPTGSGLLGSLNGNSSGPTSNSNEVIYSDPITDQLGPGEYGDISGDAGGSNGATPTPTDANNGSGSPQLSTSLQLGGETSPLSYDNAGSKLVESLQGAKTGQQEEIANRLAAQGITGGQATSMMNSANRDYMLGMSQGLGQFNLDRLSQASQVSRDYLQLELQRQLGLGQLELGSRELDSQIALKLSEMAQNADTNTRTEITNLLNTYFGDTGSGS
jgi:hypothetical protein